MKPSLFVRDILTDSFFTGALVVLCSDFRKLLPLRGVRLFEEVLRFFYSLTVPSVRFVLPWLMQIILYRNAWLLLYHMRSFPADHGCELASDVTFAVTVHYLPFPGILALYNGLGPTLVRTFPASGILFVVYEFTKSNMERLIFGM